MRSQEETPKPHRRRTRSPTVFVVEYWALYCRTWSSTNWTSSWRILSTSRIKLSMKLNPSHKKKTAKNITDLRPRSPSTGRRSIAWESRAYPAIDGALSPEPWVDCLEGGVSSLLQPWIRNESNLNMYGMLTTDWLVFEVRWVLPENWRKK